MECLDFWIDTTANRVVFQALKELIQSEISGAPITEIRLVKRILENWFEVSDIVSSFKNCSDVLVNILSEIINLHKRPNKKQLISILAG